MFWFLPLMFSVVLGVPVAFALGLVGFLGLVDNLNWIAATSQIKAILFGATNSYALSCVPMFILMGELSFKAGISDDLFEAANKWLGRLPGGLAIATNFACAIFGACSGSTIASASVFTKIALPEMIEKGYDKRLSAGAIASAGALACMIPPSILMVIYGLITSQPINKLLVAGFVPGAMTAFAYGLGIFLVAKGFPKLVPTLDAEQVSLGEKFKALTGVLPIAFLFLLVMGGLFLGWFTSTAAGAIGSAGALLVLMMRGRFTLKTFYDTLVQTGILSCSLLIIITFGNLFSFVLSSSGAIDNFVGFITGLNMAPVLVLLLIIALYVMVGCMVDPVSMLIITLPAVMPVAEAMGFDPIWFGIIVITMLEVGVITPPVGMNAYTVKAVAGDALTTGEIFSGISFFLFLQAIVLTIIISFPPIVTYLPSLMMD
ncbi:MAG: TRAP transporter large permease subunit [Deltaproteobacteria bacterium]|jgi:C4-dicarboxylate transporter, DctM subunit|nr:TRAP transporter large permease subunit [Deltaproteobacteria bacterium]